MAGCVKLDVHTDFKKTTYIQKPSCDYYVILIQLDDGGAKEDAHIAFCLGNDGAIKK